MTHIKTHVWLWAKWVWKSEQKVPMAKCDVIALKKLSKLVFSGQIIPSGAGSDKDALVKLKGCDNNTFFYSEHQRNDDTIDCHLKILWQLLIKTCYYY